MQIQLRDLEIFLKVAENQSFTKAAEQLYIAQPSVSKSVQKLERDLDVKLLDRSKKELRLTDSGMIVYEKSKEVLSLVKSMSTSLTELSDVVTGHIKVGLPQIIGTCFFPTISQLFKRNFPGVTLEIKEEGGLIIEKLVEGGLLDIGFVVLPIHNNNLTVTPIYRDSFVLCVSSHHSLANKQVVSLTDLQGEQFIMFAKSFALHGLIVNACKNVGFYPTIAYESTQWDLVMELVSAQLGIAIVPRLLANKLNGIDIVSIPILERENSWNIGIILNTNSYQSFALKEFVHTVKTVYPYD